MYVNVDGLGDSEKEFLKAIKYADNASKTITIKDIPEDFKFYQELKTIISNIKNIREGLEQNRKTLAKKIEEFAVSEKKNESIASELGTEISSTDIGADNGSTTGQQNIDLANNDLETNIASETNTQKVEEEKISIENDTSSLNIGTNNENTTGQQNINLANNVSDINIASGESIHNFENIIMSNVSIQGINSEEQERIFQYLGAELNENNKLQFTISQREEDYLYLQNSIIQLYNLSDADETRKLLSLMINNDQIKDYSIAAKKIVDTYLSTPEKFEEQFGFKLIRTNSKGIDVLNTELIYTDLFININSDLITQDANGNNIVNPTLVEVDQNMILKLKDNIDIKSNASGVIDLYLTKKGI